jgi:regulator of RNase E activity RraA
MSETTAANQAAANRAAADQAGLNVQALAERLSQVPTSTAKVILRELGVTRVVAAGIRPIVPPKGVLAGRARTVRFLPAREDVKRAPRGAVNRALIDTMGPAEVVVVDAGGFAEGAVLGDMLAARAKYRGAAGVVADGVVRDVEGLTAVGLPVFARGTHPDPSSAMLLPWETDIAVQCGGVLVQPGDWVLADTDSVVVVPADLAERVATRGEETNDEDAFCQALLAAGFPLDDAYPLPSALRPDLDRFKRDGHVPAWDEVRARR